MLGVVLWSDQDDRKAVFWCEDHGDLAYYEAPDLALCATEFFDAGDMVQFDVNVDHRLRKAYNPKVVQERASSGLPESLKRTANLSSPSHRKCAQIIAFNVKDDVHEEKPVAMKA